MIEIQDLEGLNVKEIANLLLEEEQPFDIYIPKSTELYSSGREDIAIDYSFLAYSGQLLFDVSDEFEYDEIQPQDHESVPFTIKPKSIELLAFALLEISYGYVNDHPENDQFSYGEEAANYLDEVEDGKIEKIACPYFVDVCQEFFKEDEENEEGEKYDEGM